MWVQEDGQVETDICNLFYFQFLFHQCGSTTYWQEITLLFPKESVGSCEQAVWAGHAHFSEE